MAAFGEGRLLGELVVRRYLNIVRGLHREFEVAEARALDQLFLHEAHPRDILVERDRRWTREVAVSPHGAVVEHAHAWIFRLKRSLPIRHRSHRPCGWRQIFDGDHGAWVLELVAEIVERLSLFVFGHRVVLTHGTHREVYFGSTGVTHASVSTFKHLKRLLLHLLHLLHLLQLLLLLLLEDCLGEERLSAHKLLLLLPLRLDYLLGSKQLLDRELGTESLVG